MTKAETIEITVRAASMMQHVAYLMNNSDPVVVRLCIASLLDATNDLKRRIDEIAPIKPMCNKP